ncbi:septal ring lytic transglycosylase RlpA family protein [Azohydromonas sp. G-1-1-14]|uniref:Endolytic peptidoglycan transglycosylase RlpA n=2 Tax=Azohydromonas caseinilytica TaxID=2728836 RepID=A0A848FKA9_9BURK|nr:septal ring lytic transglycosylase RlpA family protein [Azohydromonas caseinilytica]
MASASKARGTAVTRKAASAKGATVARKAAPARSSPVQRRAAASGARLDFSGRRRVGEASYYAHKFAGRKMADGTRMRLNHHNAASKTLPLGTIAKVTNLKTGKSAVVKIQDRGPFVKGRIVDLSPATARQIGLTAREGVGPVAVTPIAVPLPDGSVKPGEAAREPMARTQVAQGRGD